MLLHILGRTQVEDLIRKLFVCQEPTSDGVNDGQPIFLGERFTHSPSLSLQQRDFSTEGILQRGRSVLLSRKQLYTVQDTVNGAYT